VSPRLLRLALRAYPGDRRRRDGDVLLDTALELAADGGSSVRREAGGLALAGLAERAARAVPPPLRGAPWRAALARLGLPLAVANLALWSAGVARWGPLWPLGWRWSALLAGSLLALAGVAWSRRAIAATGAGLVVLATVGGHLLGLPGVYAAEIGMYTVGVDAAAVPLVLLLLAATWVPRRPRSPLAGLRRAAWAILPAAAAFAAVRADRGTPEDPDTLLLAAIGAVTALAFAAGVVRMRRDPAGAVAGSLALAAVAPEAVWIGLGTLGISDGPWLNLSLLSGAGLLAAAIVLAPIRAAARTP
jgi:hypothetical protein